MFDIKIKIRSIFLIRFLFRKPECTIRQICVYPRSILKILNATDLHKFRQTGMFHPRYNLKLETNAFFYYFCLLILINFSRE